MRDRTGRRPVQEREKEVRQDEALEIIVDREDRRVLAGDNRENANESYEDAMERIERNAGGLSPLLKTKDVVYLYNIDRLLPLRLSRFDLLY